MKPSVLYQLAINSILSMAEPTGINLHMSNPEHACRSFYEKQCAKFRKLLSASGRDISLSEIVDYIDKIIVDSGREIVVK